VLGAAASGPWSLEHAAPPGDVPWPGERADGLPLTTALESPDRLSFVYGDCLPTGDAGCAPPVEIQVWRACRRHRSLYRSPLGPAGEAVTVRGVPGLAFDGRRRIELQTGRSTIVVFADSAARAERVAAALRSDDGRIRPGDRLPVPEPGALEGVVDS
jgi:hypothetical protein